MHTPDSHYPGHDDGRHVHHPRAVHVAPQQQGQQQQQQQPQPSLQQLPVSSIAQAYKTESPTSRPRLVAQSAGPVPVNKSSPTNRAAAGPTPTRQWHRSTFVRITSREKAGVSTFVQLSRTDTAASLSGSVPAIGVASTTSQRPQARHFPKPESRHNRRKRLHQRTRSHDQLIASPKSQQPKQGSEKSRKSHPSSSSHNNKQQGVRSQSRPASKARVQRAAQKALRRVQSEVIQPQLRNHAPIRYPQPLLPRGPERRAVRHVSVSPGLAKGPAIAAPKVGRRATTPAEAAVGGVMVSRGCRPLANPFTDYFDTAEDDIGWWSETRQDDMRLLSSPSQALLRQRKLEASLRQSAQYPPRIVPSTDTYIAPSHGFPVSALVTPAIATAAYLAAQSNTEGSARQLRRDERHAGIDARVRTPQRRSPTPVRRDQVPAHESGGANNPDARTGSPPTLPEGLAHAQQRRANEARGAMCTAGSSSSSVYPAPPSRRSTRSGGGADVLEITHSSLGEFSTLSHITEDLPLNTSGDVTAHAPGTSERYYRYHNHDAHRDDASEVGSEEPPTARRASKVPVRRRSRGTTPGTPLYSLNDGSAPVSHKYRGRKPASPPDSALQVELGRRDWRRVPSQQRGVAYSMHRVPAPMQPAPLYSATQDSTFVKKKKPGSRGGRQDMPDAHGHQHSQPSTSPPRLLIGTGAGTALRVAATATGGAGSNNAPRTLAAPSLRHADSSQRKLRHMLGSTGPERPRHLTQVHLSPRAEAASTAHARAAAAEHHHRGYHRHHYQYDVDDSSLSRSASAMLSPITDPLALEGSHTLTPAVLHQHGGAASPVQPRSPQRSPVNVVYKDGEPNGAHDATLRARQTLLIDTSAKRGQHGDGDGSGEGQFSPPITAQWRYKPSPKYGPPEGGESFDDVDEWGGAVMSVSPLARARAGLASSHGKLYT